MEKQEKPKVIPKRARKKGKKASIKKNYDVQIIPAKAPSCPDTENELPKIRVGAYCRVSTDEEAQASSFELQVDYYTGLINSRDDWVLAGIYADEGISGTQTRHRDNFNRKLMLFELDEPEMIKVEEIVLPPKEEESEGETVKKTIYIFPPEWAGTFGQPITSVAQIGILQQEHYAGNWDVLRPASEIKEMNIFTADGLNTLLHEAEEIMEGWIDIDGGKQNVNAAEGAGVGD